MTRSLLRNFRFPIISPSYQALVSSDSLKNNAIITRIVIIRQIITRIVIIRQIITRIVIICLKICNYYQELLLLRKSKVYCFGRSIKHYLCGLAMKTERAYRILQVFFTNWLSRQGFPMALQIYLFLNFF